MGAPEQARACNNPTGSVYSFAVTSTAIINYTYFVILNSRYVMLFTYVVYNVFFKMVGQKCNVRIDQDNGW